MLCRRYRLIPLAALATFLFVPIPLQAAEKPPVKKESPAAGAKVDAKARKLIEKMSAAYADLKSFSATISTQGGGPEVPQFTSTLQFKKPNFARLETRAKDAKLTVTSDGANIFILRSDSDKVYIKMPAPQSFTGMIGLVLETAGGIGIGPTNLLLTGGDPLPSERLLKTLTVGEPGTEGGVPVERVAGSLEGQPGKQPKFEFYLGKDDHLIRKVTLEAPGSVSGVLTETHSDIKVNPELPTSSFTFTPPPGSKAIDPPTEPAFYHPDLKPGADPFPISAKDMSGKDFSLDQYKGKVVLLDFWATWCGPCVEELPNVAAAYKKFKAKGFDVVSISLDEAKDRESVNTFLKKYNMAWRQVYEGKGWGSEIASKYQVQAIPFALLIGKDGKIEAVNVRGEDLEPAISKALGK
jgi:outer membrane lipoprotein-sorting protein/cytochrome oxidase Cu insertion factor (SCO1/SenC/PrrC family)